MTYSGAVPATPMEHHPWQTRARAAGLTQRTLSKLLGFAEITISRQLRGQWKSGMPDHVKAAILAWEIMTPEQRQAWLAETEKVRAADSAASATKASPEDKRPI